MFSFICAAFLLGMASMATAQPAEILWTQVYGGPAIEKNWFVQETTDGGFIMTGYTASEGAGGRDAWLIKTDFEGNEEWRQTYGGELNDWGAAVRQTSDGGYVMAGMVDSSAALQGSCWGVRLNSDGDTLWTIVIDTDGYSSFYSVRETHDKGLIFVGWFYDPDRQAIAVRTNNEGEILWSRVYGGWGDEYFGGVIETPEGDFLLAGSTSTWGSGDRDFYLLCVNADGDSLWQEEYGGWSDDFCFAVEKYDEDYLLVGATRSGDALDADGWVVVVSPTGEVLFDRMYGGGAYEILTQAAPTIDGGWMLTGQTTTWGLGPRSIWMVRADAELLMEWNYTVLMPLEQWCFSGVPSSDGNYVITASSEYNTFGGWDCYLIKIGIAPECQPQTAHLVPTLLDFGLVEIGESEQRFFAVQNPDTCDLIVFAVTAPEGFETDFTGPVTIEPDGSLAISVDFMPTQAGIYRDDIVINSNAADSPSLLTVQGVGGGPAMTVQPPSLEFGEVQVGTETTRTLTVTSSGTATLEVDNIYTPPPFTSDFVGPAVLPPGAQLEVNVTFAPDTAQVYEDILVIVTNLVPPTSVVVMSGTGTPLDADDPWALQIDGFELSGVYPNPFNPSTTVTFEVPKTSDVSITVYDVLGRETAVLMNGTVAVGRHQIQWTCPDCAAGVYLVAMQSSEFRAVTKAVFLK